MSNENGRVRYNRTWSADLTDLDIELTCFRHGLSVEKGGLGKSEHFWNIVEILWGENNPKKRFVRNPWSEDQIREACRWKMLAITGPANSSKSDTFAMWAIVNFIARPAHTLILITSTSLTESRLRIWGSVEEYWNSVPGLPGKLVSTLGIIRYQDPETGARESDRCGIRLIAGDKTNERDAVQKLIGIKRQDGALILIGDELPELSPAILGSLSNLTSQPNFQLIGLGNAKSQFDPHGELCTPKNGWNSITDQDGAWETELGYCLHFDAEKSPNVLARKVIFPFLPKTAWVEGEKQKKGENSLEYWRMVRGFWSPDGATEGVYAESDITVYDCGSSQVKFVETPIAIAGLDLGFTNGGDETTLQFALLGLADTGCRVLKFTDRLILRHDVTLKMPRAYQIANQVKAACIERHVSPLHFGFDATGGGTAYGDIFAETWSPEIYRVEFGGAPTELMVGQIDPKPAKELYADRASEIWYVGRDFMRGGNIRGVDMELSRDLISRKGTTIKRARALVMQVESKRETKRRIKRSPDKGEAALIALDTARARLDFQPNIAVISKQITSEKWRAFVGHQEELDRSVIKHLIDRPEEIPLDDPSLSYAEAIRSLRRAPVHQLVIGDDFDTHGLM